MASVSEDEDEDMRDLDDDSRIRIGIQAGNINIQSTDDNDNEQYIYQMSKEAEAAQTEHQQLLKSIEEKRVKQNLRVPTDDNEVKQRLRALREPICYFAEDAADRRDRLRDIIASMISSGKEIPEFRKDRKQLEIDLATIAEKINAKRPYWSRGNPWIKVIRTKILHYSLKRASSRISIQLKQREDPLPPHKMKEEENKIISNLSSFICQSSYYNNVNNKSRPLTSCDISCRTSDTLEHILLFGTGGGNITIWNESGQMKNEIDAHRERITSVRIMPFKSSSDSQYSNIKFISCSADGITKLWNCSGDELGEYDSNKHNKVSSSYRLGKCAFHPMSSYFASTSFDRSWSFWDIEREIPLFRQEGHSTSVYSVDFHPDGSLIGTGDLGGIVRIWDLRSGRAIFGGDSHSSSILDLSFNCNGYIFASCSSDNTVKIWDLRKHTEYTIPAHFNLISSIQFEPHSGQYLVSGSFDKTVKIWSMKKSGSYNFKLTHEMKGHHSRITDLKISKPINNDINKQFIITCSHDKTWKLWANKNYDDEKENNDDDDIKIKIKQEEQDNSTKKKRKNLQKMEMD